MKRSEKYMAALVIGKRALVAKLVPIAIADNPELPRMEIYAEVGKDLGMTSGAVKVAFTRTSNGNENKAKKYACPASLPKLVAWLDENGVTEDEWKALKMWVVWK